MPLLFGGVDGGTSNTRIVLLDKSGNQLTFVEGPPTNHWVIGLKEACQRIVDLVELALKKANLPPDTVIDHLCLSLSGVDTEDNRCALKTALNSAKPELAGTIRICNDSVGTRMAATDEGALVLISGTGSICNYIRRDLTETRLGGYGYLLGDNGSATWIALQALATFLEIQDGLLPWEHSLDKIRQAIYSHFGITEPLGLLPHFYKNFNKSKIAELCEQLAFAAESGEPLCLHLFYRAGIQLGRYAKAGTRQIIKDMKHLTQDITIICCGSVFKSWHLLRSGFCDAVLAEPLGWQGCLRLVRLQLPAAYGAARIAARLDAGLELPIQADAVSALETIAISGCVEAVSPTYNASS